MQFTINGRQMALDSDQVALAVRGVQPGSVQTHGVIVEGVTLPVKQVFARATGLSADSFTSQTARRHLAALGFTLVGTARPRSGPTLIQSRSGQRRLSEPAGAGPLDPHAWPWEGAVQDVFAASLRDQGWEITGCADTATKAHGVDVLARKEQRMLGAEVKGWPSTGYADPRRAAETKRTQPTNQAGHWYSQALMKAVMLLDSHPGYESLVVLPDYPRYRDLAHRTATGRDRAGVHVVFVTAEGTLDSEAWRP